MSILDTSFYSVNAHGVLEREYPCRCGDIHQGEYAFEAYQEHNCFHNAPLWKVAEDQAICVECGKSFRLDRNAGSDEDELVST